MSMRVTRARRSLLVASLVAGCGRLSFDARGGAVTDGAPGDGTVDTMPDDAGPSCVGFDLCETFEDTIDAAWSRDPDVTIDTTFAHRGTHSARMHMVALVAGTSHASRLFETRSLTPVPAELWVRAWVRMGGLPDNNNRLELISMEHNGGGGAGDYVFSRSTTTLIYVEPDAITQTTTGLVPDTWTCLVFHVVFSTTSNGSLDLAIDDIPTLAIPTTTTNDTQFAVDTVGIGPYFGSTNVLNNQGPFDVWVDDVIVHGSAVTCGD